MKHKAIRKLARSARWQNLYNRAKEIGTLKLFHNTENLTHLQLEFLHWLSVYSWLYSEKASGAKYVSKELINDDYRTDGYLLYKDKEITEGQKNKNNGILDTNKQMPNSGGLPSIKFVSKPKKK